MHVHFALQLIDARDSEEGYKHERMHQPVVFGTKPGESVAGLDSDGLPAVGTYLTTGQPYYRWVGGVVLYEPPSSWVSCY